YEALSQQYDTLILPARPAKTRDKAKTEDALTIAARWIHARLRHETFLSLTALNARIAEWLHELNDRPMRLYQASRRELFERLDRPALRPLPPEPFVYAEWKSARVNIDYHVEIRRHYYSVPFSLVHEVVDVRVTATTVEGFHKGQRVAAHVRDDTPGARARLPRRAGRLAGTRRRAGCGPEHELRLSAHLAALPSLGLPLMADLLMDTRELEATVGKIVREQPARVPEATEDSVVFNDFVAAMGEVISAEVTKAVNKVRGRVD
ncbi:MAG: hypothetical protein HY726_09000, partial [Candidatus Rokubacteria bacterium]|nr:hypothetical protein [Candidatus Rokubacteria bacterium]